MHDRGAVRFPIVVKPSSQGSALGISSRAAGRHARGARGCLLVRLAGAARALRRRPRPAVSILDGDPLPVVEAVPTGDGFYDFEARYEIGRTEFVCPATLPDGLRVGAADLRAAGLLGVRAGRMLGADGELTVLEANPIPGLTETSCCRRPPRPRGSPSTSWWDGSSSSRSSAPRPKAAFLFLFLAVLAVAKSSGGDVVAAELLDDLLGVLDLVLELDGGLPITSSAAKMGAPVRTARASASEGRESIDLAAVS